MDMGMVTLISVGINALAAVLAPIIARKLTQRTEQLKQVEAAASAMSQGLTVIETAVNAVKESDGTGAGNKVAERIKQYGLPARLAVDTARTVARTLREKAEAEYEARIIAEERAEHQARLAADEDAL